MDHRLIPPATGHEILADIKDAFQFLDRDLNSQLKQHLRTDTPDVKLDPSRIAVAGSSSGGLCAYLAAMYAVPKPKALLSLYGMGGDMLTPQYFTPKTQVFFRGREMLDPGDFSDFLHPSSQTLPPTSDSPLAYHPETHHIPGYPANQRMLLGRLYLQLGVYLDYYTGMHAPSLSAALRKFLSEGQLRSGEVQGLRLDEIKCVLPEDQCDLFPQFGVTRDWPPCFLVHGADDSAVLADESRHMHELLQDAGVDVMLRILPGEEHSLDYQSGANDKYGQGGGLFDEAVEFLLGFLGS